jgi:GNAT superfamily N-acetyltransferase
MSDLLPAGGLIRKLWSGDRDACRDHLLRLDPASRHSRFGGGVSDDFIRNYVELSKDLDTVLHGFLADGTLRGVAELRLLGRNFPREAEVALSIEKPWQRHGVGVALLERTLLSARNRGVKLLHLACLADNRPMQQLVRKFGAELTFERGSVDGALATRRPTLLSLMRESYVDTIGFATAALDLQQQLLKPA